jgi:hypothetical protein
MKKVDKLTRAQLEMALETIQAHAYAVFTGPGDHGYWDPNKDLGSDFIGMVLHELEFAGLAPKKRTRF